MKPQHLAFLITGIVVTVLFIVFGEWIYELNYVNGFSDQMHNLELNMPTAIITALIPWGVAAIYYYLINSVLFDRWYHWLVMLALVVVITPTVCYLVNSSSFADNNLSYVTEHINFEIVNSIWAGLLFIVASFSIRWWSSNCRHTPIPE